ncbi:MAG: hypothetical protein ABI690_34445 [Chloroflexota bacterium]
MSVFPLVKQVWSSRNASDESLAQPYANWHLQAFDSYLNVMVSRHVGDLAQIAADDLVILVGAVAREWLRTQPY